MTIEEAIEHFRIIEKDSKQEALNIASNLYLPKSIDRDRLVTDCNRVADENKQIAEWLEELKELRSQKSNWLLGYDTSRDLFYYNKALDDAIAECRKTSGEYIDTFSDYLCAGLHMAVRIAEKLKAGGKNDD